MRINYWHEYIPERSYHIYNRSNGRKDLFVDGQDYERFLNKYFVYFGHIFDTVAFCLMPNHYHFIVTVKDQDTIKTAIKSPTESTSTSQFLLDKISIDQYARDQFRRWLSSYTLYKNKKYKDRGQLFSNRHKSILIQDNERFIDLVCYTHHNPIHHGFCGEYHQWDYSSHAAYFTQEKTKINTSLVLDLTTGAENLKERHKNFQFSMLEYED